MSSGNLGSQGARCAIVYRALTLFHLLLLYGCGQFICSHFDVKPKHDYIRNKIIFLAALIEQHKSLYGQYPESLEEIRAAYILYLQMHPEMTDFYICAPWTRRKIDVFMGPTGQPFLYRLDPDTGKYFLYTSWGPVSEESYNLAYLRETLIGQHIRSSLYVVYGGEILSGAGCPHAKGINLENMTDYMRRIDYRGHTFVP